MTEKKPIAILRTKAEILTSRDLGKVVISDKVTKNPAFESAKMMEKLGFLAISGSDYTIIDVISVQDNPKAFLELAFGPPGVKK